MRVRDTDLETFTVQCNLECTLIWRTVHPILFQFRRKSPETTMGLVKICVIESYLTAVRTVLLTETFDGPRSAYL